MKRERSSLSLDEVFTCGKRGISKYWLILLLVIIVLSVYYVSKSRVRLSPEDEPFDESNVNEVFRTCHNYEKERCEGRFADGTDDVWEDLEECLRYASSDARNVAQADSEKCKAQGYIVETRGQCNTQCVRTPDELEEIPEPTPCTCENAAPIVGIPVDKCRQARCHLNNWQPESPEIDERWIDAGNSFDCAEELQDDLEDWTIESKDVSCFVKKDISVRCGTSEGSLCEGYMEYSCFDSYSYYNHPFYWKPTGEDADCPRAITDEGIEQQQCYCRGDCGNGICETHEGESRDTCPKDCNDCTEQNGYCLSILDYSAEELPEELSNRYCTSFGVDNLNCHDENKICCSITECHTDMDCIGVAGDNNNFNKLKCFSATCVSAGEESDDVASVDCEYMGCDGQSASVYCQYEWNGVCQRGTCDSRGNCVIGGSAGADDTGEDIEIAGNDLPSIFLDNTVVLASADISSLQGSQLTKVLREWVKGTLQRRCQVGCCVRG